MHGSCNRRQFLRTASILGLAATATTCDPTEAGEPIRRSGGPHLRVALNAYSFSKLLNDGNKGRSGGLSYLELIDFCAEHDFDDGKDASLRDFRDLVA